MRIATGMQILSSGGVKGKIRKITAIIIGETDLTKLFHYI